MSRAAGVSVALGVPALFFSAAIAAARDGGTAGAPMEGRVVAGWVDTGWIGAPPLKIKVKLDTGAKTSSIHAAQFREYEKDGVRRVSFTLTNNEGAELAVDEPVVRTVTIRRAATGLQERPVIRLRTCIAGVTSQAEFTLADRSELSYPVLVGRSFLAGKILVDPGRTFLAPDTCPRP